MRNYLIIIIFIALGHIQIMGQYYDYYEWGEDNYKKKKYDQAENYLFKAIEDIDLPSIRAASWLYLMDIYRTGKVNDSLYLVCKKALIRNGYETPNYRIVYVGFDPTSYIPEIPEIDLYGTSRELVCELYEREEYDSALYYFNNYARRSHEKGWCGVGKQNNYMYDQIMLARLSAALGDTVLAFKWLDLAPYIDPYDLPQAHYLEIFCFYNNVQTLYPEYHKGDILAELEKNFHVGKIRGEQVNFCTSFRGRDIYFHEEWTPRILQTKTDSLAVIDSTFHQTLLYRMIEFKDKVRFDTVVTLSGSLSFGTNDVTFFSNNISFDVEGWDMKDQPRGYIELTGRFLKDETSKSSWWSYDSKLMAPESYSKKTIQLISYKPISQ